jgi:hypothetical protein
MDADKTKPYPQAVDKAFANLLILNSYTTTCFTHKTPALTCG